MQILQGITFTTEEVDENAGVAAIMARDSNFKPVIDDRKKRDLTRLPLAALTTFTDGSADVKPVVQPLQLPDPAGPDAAVTQAERDAAQKAASAAAAVAALDGEVLEEDGEAREDEVPHSGGDGMPSAEGGGPDPPKKAPSAKEVIVDARLPYLPY